MTEFEVFGPFDLLTELSAGGMAVTYLARVAGSPPGSEFVIKRILPRLQGDEELQILFGEEARIAELLVHPNLVRTFGHGRVAFEHFLAMEYVWGEDLRRVGQRGAQTGSSLDHDLVAYVIAQAAHGLHHAHGQTDEEGRPFRLVHRDVSPPNIMVGFDGAVKVVDFGIAKVERHIQRVRQGQLKGKFGYMSPEQVRGLEVDHRSDIFALGTILFELTMLRRLFRADSDIATIKLVSEARVPSPTEIDPEYPPRLAEIVFRALAQDPTDRYQSAGDLADDLLLLLGPDVIDGAPARLRDWTRRAFPERATQLDALLGELYAGPTLQPLLPEMSVPLAARSNATTSSGQPDDAAVNGGGSIAAPPSPDGAESATGEPPEDEPMKSDDGELDAQPDRDAEELDLDDLRSLDDDADEGSDGGPTEIPDGAADALPPGEPDHDEGEDAATELDADDGDDGADDEGDVAEDQAEEICDDAGDDEDTGQVSGGEEEDADDDGQEERGAADDGEEEEDTDQGEEDTSGEEEDGADDDGQQEEADDDGQQEEAGDGQQEADDGGQQEEADDDGQQEADDGQEEEADDDGQDEVADDDGQEEEADDDGQEEADDGEDAAAAVEEPDTADGADAAETAEAVEGDEDAESPVDQSDRVPGPAAADDSDDHAAAPLLAREEISAPVRARVPDPLADLTRELTEDDVRDSMERGDRPPDGALVTTEHELPEIRDNDEFVKSSRGGALVYAATAVVAAVLLVFIGIKLVNEGVHTSFFDGIEYPDPAEFAPEAIERPDPPPRVDVALATEPEGAAVIVNGIASRQRTPTTVSLVADVLNTVSLHLEGHETTFVNLDAGESLDLSPIALTPIDPPSAEAEAAASEAAAAAAEGSGDPGPGAGRGRLNVVARTTAGDRVEAEVLLNGEAQPGTTPLSVDVDSRQVQHLTVRAGGLRDSAAYAEARVWEGPLTAREVILEMTADIGDANAWTTLRLLPTPRESELSIDGEPHRGAGAVNLQSSLHHVVEVSAPDHEDWVRGFEGTVGQLAVSAILTPIRTGPSLLTLTVEPEGATIYAEQLRHGSPGATEIGTTAVQGREFDAGRYRLTFDLTTEEGRARGRVEVDLEPGTHHVLGYRLEEGGATSTRDDRIPIASP